MAKRTAVSWLTACLLIAACGSSQQPSADPAQLLREAGAAMATLKSVTATLKFTKGSVSFQGFSLVTAKAAVRLPGESDTTYTVKQQDLSIGLQVVITGGRVYLHLPFSSLQEVTGAEAAAIPDLAKFFDLKTGLPAVIPDGHDSKYSGQSTVDGVATEVVDAKYSPDQVRGMLAQLSSQGDIQARVWIGSSDHLIRKATLDGAFGDGGKESSVEVDLGGFNAAVSITSPSP
jgi:hypothetical protein